MLEALSLNSLLNESAGIRDRIIFESVPSSQKYLTVVIQAIRDNKVLHVVYKGYRMAEEVEFILEPYCLREFKKRWYLFAHKGNDESPHMFALDNFDHLLDEIREIRASERLFYQKITDIYATAYDYDPQSLITQNFFSAVQNKIHYATHEQAKLYAESQFERYRLIQDAIYSSDFDLFAKAVEASNPAIQD